MIVCLISLVKFAAIDHLENITEYTVATVRKSNNKPYDDDNDDDYNNNNDKI